MAVQSIGDRDVARACAVAQGKKKFVKKKSLMDRVWNVVTVATVTLAFNIIMRAFGGGWGLSGRLTKIEAGMTAMQGEITKLVDVLKEVADMNGRSAWPSNDK